MRLRLAAIVLLTIAVTGCAAQEAPTSGETPQAFRDREALPSCGDLDLDQGEVVPEDAVACVAAGIGGEGAELVVTAPTVEGDPIVTYYRGLPDGGVEIWFDATEDSHGEGWWHSVCPDATSLLELGECQEEHLT